MLNLARTALPEEEGKNSNKEKEREKNRILRDERNGSGRKCEGILE